MMSSSRSGIVLIISLWLMSALLCLVLSLVRLIGEYGHFIKAAEYRLQARILAYAGYQRAEEMLADLCARKIGHLRPVLRHEISIPAAPLRGCVFMVSDEHARININTASRRVLRELPGIDARMIEAVMSFRSAVPITSLAQLAKIVGSSSWNSAETDDMITFFGDGSININTASRDVLTWCGLEKELVTRIVLFRRGRDGLTGTADDQVFVSPQEVYALCTNPPEIACLRQLFARKSITISSSLCRIESQGWVEVGKKRLTVSLRIVCALPGDDKAVGDYCAWEML